VDDQYPGGKVPEGSTPTETAFLVGVAAIGADPTINTVDSTPDLVWKDSDKAAPGMASLRYNPLDDTLIIDIEEVTGTLFAAMKPFLDDQDVRMVLKVDNLTNAPEFFGDWDFAEKLHDIHFTSVDLTVIHGRYADVGFLGDVVNLTSLGISITEPIATLPVMPTLQELTFDVSMVDGSTISFEGLETQPALQKLVLFRSRDNDRHYDKLDAIGRCKTLSDVSFTGELRDGKLRARDAEMLESLRQYPNIRTLQMMDAESFTADQVAIPETPKETKPPSDEQWLKDLVESYKGGKLQEGVAPNKIEGKVIIYTSNAYITYEDQPHGEYHSLQAALAGRDYANIPNSHLAATRAECSYVLYVTSENGSVVGTYTGGGSAITTLSVVAIIDVSNNTVSPKIMVAETDPPDSFTGPAKTNAVGPFDPEAVRTFLAGLLL
jgi:hypothetical protein